MKTIKENYNITQKTYVQNSSTKYSIDIRTDE